MSGFGKLVRVIIHHFLRFIKFHFNFCTGISAHPGGGLRPRPNTQYFSGDCGGNATRPAASGTLPRRPARAPHWTPAAGGGPARSCSRPGTAPGRRPPGGGGRSTPPPGEKGPLGLLLPLQAPQAQPVQRLPGTDPHPHAAPAPARKGTQVLPGLFPVPQTEGGAGDQASILAFTRYSPAVTPPKRYIPAALVLVAAIRVSAPPTI